MSDFFDKVDVFVKKIPTGRFMTYGQVAAEVGYPRGAMMVGWALSRLSPSVPWQRMVNREGMISIENLEAPKELQVDLLRKEKIKVRKIKGNFFVDLDKYKWDPRKK